MARRAGRAVLFAAVLIVSVVAGSVALAGTAAASPPGFVTVGSEVSEQTVDPSNPPQNALQKQAQRPSPPMHALEKMPDNARENVLASRGTVQVQWAPTETGQPTLVVTDDEQHESAEVAVPIEAYESSLGEVPNLAYGVHENGTEWTAPIKVEDGYAVVVIPHFSTNTVSFEAEITVSGDPAEDGASFEYELGSDENPENALLEVTGVNSTGTDSASGTDMGDGDNLSVDVGGTEKTTVNVSIDGKLTKIEPASGGYDANVELNDMWATTFNEETGWMFAGGSDGGVKAYDSNGDEQWSVSSNWVNDINVHHSSNTVISTEVNGGPTTAWDGSTGDVIWSKSINGEGVGVHQERGLVYVSHSSSVSAYYVENGTEKWNSPASSDGEVRVHQERDIVYSAGGSLDALDAVDGGDMGSYSGNSDTLGGVAVDEKDDVVYTGGLGDTLHAVNVSDNSQLWTKSFSGNTNGMAVDPAVDRVFVAVYGGGLQAVNTTSQSVEYSAGYGDGDGYDASIDSASKRFAIGDGFNTVTVRKYASGTDSPHVDVGGSSVGTNESLMNGESFSDTVELDHGDYTANLSLNSGVGDVSLSWDEVTQSVDPSVTISSDAGSQTATYSGTLANGTTAELSDQVNKSKIGGNVTVDVAVSESYGGPIGKVGLNWKHDAVEERTIEYEGEAFSERYNFSHTWDVDRDDPQLRVPWASDRVVEVRKLTVDGQETSDWQWDSGDLLVDVGSVQAGETTNITAVGSKIRTTEGEVVVQEVTADEDDQLNSKIEIVDDAGTEYLEIDVTGIRHVESLNRLIYTTDETWADADPYTEISVSGQRLIMEVGQNETLRLKSADVGARAMRGSAKVKVLDPNQPRLEISPADENGGILNVSYHATVSGDYYRVLDPANDRTIDTDKASSPAYFEVSADVGEVIIERFEPDVTAGAVFGAGASDSNSPIPSWVWLFASVLGSLGLLTAAVRRTDLGSTSGERLVLTAGVVIVGLVAVELVTDVALMAELMFWGGTLVTETIPAYLSQVPLWLLPILAGTGAVAWIAYRRGPDAATAAVSRTTSGVTSVGSGLIGAAVGTVALAGRWMREHPTGVAIIGLLGVAAAIATGVISLPPELTEEFLPIVAAVGLLLALIYVDQGTKIELSLPVYVGVSALVLVFVLESLSGGIVDALASGLEEVGPLIWLALIGGGAALIYLWIRAQRQPDTTVTLDLGRRGN